MKTLYLNLKFEYFDAIKSGEKEFEYREFTKYWIKRLYMPNCFDAIEFDEIVILRAYPKKDDLESRMVRPWRGFNIETITHKHSGKDPVKVFAIRVN